jgi:hypothetical protein
MCDVSNTSCDSGQRSKRWKQVCKYPEKTKRRISKLAPKDKINVPVTAPRQPKAPSRPLDGGWKRNFREGDDEDEDVSRPSANLNRPPSRSTNSSTGTFSSHGTNKRLGAGNSSANAKKAKVAYAPLLGKSGK